MFFCVIFVKHLIFKMFSKFKFISDCFCVFYNAPRIIGLWYAKICAHVVIRRADFGILHCKNPYGPVFWSRTLQDHPGPE